MITRISSFIPAKRLSNSELASALGRWTPDEIFRKTGILTRSISEDDETAVDLGLGALRGLLSTASLSIDFLIFCSQTGDYKLPSSACILQGRSGLPTNCAALDVNLACSGYIYCLALADSLLRSGAARNVVIINSDTYTKYIHPQDTVCRPIFGDGAAATLLSKSSPANIVGFDFGTDGKNGFNMLLPAGGSKSPSFRDPRITPNLTPADPEYLKMNGPEIYNFTLRVVPQSVDSCLEKASLKRDQVDHFVFHQANAFMLESLRKKMGLPIDKFIVEMSETGNLVSASIPVVLERMLKDGRIRSGQKTLLCGFGVGLSWGSCIVEW
jgi:3-oxoacyl-[acyl-carrier-protein] synthase-3